MYDSIYNGEIKWFDSPFTDCYHEFVTKAYSLGVISGKTGTEFRPDDPVTREEMAQILVNTIETAGFELNIANDGSEIAYGYSDFYTISEWARDAFVKAVQYGMMSGLSDTELAPLANATREQAVAIINRGRNLFEKSETEYTAPVITGPNNGDLVSGDTIWVLWDYEGPAQEFVIMAKDETENCIDISTSVEKNAGIDARSFENGHTYSVVVGAIYSQNAIVFSEPVYVEFEAPVETPVPVMSPYSDKNSRVFPYGRPFETKEEADSYMTTVQVPVWKLSGDGSKYSSVLSLTVNLALADEVVQIFTEIYNDPEQFPIKNASGYTWRNTAMGKVSEHSYGTCIDINYDENYYCYAETGEAITGSFWRPGENPYSIPADGSVVRAFAKYGWAWGGNAWTRLRDYMHFTFLGN